MKDFDEIESLKAKIAVLEEENISLSQNAEDLFLINTLFDTIQKTTNKYELYQSALEKLAILKNIPLCALFYKKSSLLEVISSYALFSCKIESGFSLKVDESIYNEILYEVISIPKEKIPSLNIQLVCDNEDFVCTEILLIPFYSLLTGECVLLLCDRDETGNRLSKMSSYLSYVVNRISERFDTNYYHHQLHKLNHELEGRVIERTNELLELTKQLKLEIDERKNYENKLETSEAKLSKQNEELVNAIAKAKEIDKLKSIFFANMSHELRTPLVGLLGFSEILEYELSGEPRDFALKIHKSGQRLLNTLNEILTYSELEAGKVLLNLEEVDIVKLVDDEIELFYILAAQKKLKICKKFEVRTKKMITDEKLLRSICSNLINNAIKYTLEGSVTVSLSAGSHSVIISVTDTGIGIPKDKYNFIFEEFRQVSEGVKRFFDGAGLGLSIVKKYCELLSGTISVESQENVGSIFKVELPLIENTKKNPKPGNDKQHRSAIELFTNANPSQLKKILLVDDEEINAEVINQFLKNKYRIDISTNGLDSIEKAGSNKYDIVLMDINLKNDMSGLEAAKKILALPGYEKVPIVAITAFAMKGDRDEFLSAGCSYYLAKPFTKQQILDLIDGILK